MKVIIAAAGTAGHINPGLAIANKIKEKNKDAQIMFIGTDRGLENDLVPRSGYELKTIDAYGFSKSISITNIKHMIKTMHGFSQAKKIVEEFKPDLVIDSRSNSEEEIKKEEVKEEIKQEEKRDNEEEIDRFNIFENMLKKEDTTMNNDSSDLFLQKDENIVKVNKSEDFIDNEMNSIFNNFSEKDEKFVSYYVHIVRENDNIDTICLKYGVSVEKIKEYNNIDQIALGSKIIIPYIVNEAI
mgnify:CR=1 FL=1